MPACFFDQLSCTKANSQRGFTWWLAKAVSNQWPYQWMVTFLDAWLWTFTTMVSPLWAYRLGPGNCPLTVSMLFVLHSRVRGTSSTYKQQHSKSHSHSQNMKQRRECFRGVLTLKTWEWVLPHAWVEARQCSSTNRRHKKSISAEWKDCCYCRSIFIVDTEMQSSDYRLPSDGDIAPYMDLLSSLSSFRKELVNWGIPQPTLHFWYLWGLIRSSNVNFSSSTISCF